MKLLTIIVMIEFALVLLFAMLGCVMFFIYLIKQTYDSIRDARASRGDRGEQR